MYIPLCDWVVARLDDVIRLGACYDREKQDFEKP